jgi:hypothetical protein
MYRNILHSFAAIIPTTQCTCGCVRVCAGSCGVCAAVMPTTQCTCAYANRPMLQCACVSNACAVRLGVKCVRVHAVRGAVARCDVAHISRRDAIALQHEARDAPCRLGRLALHGGRDSTCRLRRSCTQRRNVARIPRGAMQQLRCSSCGAAVAVQQLRCSSCGAAVAVQLRGASPAARRNTARGPALLPLSACAPAYAVCAAGASARVVVSLYFGCLPDGNPPPSPPRAEGDNGGRGGNGGGK